MKIKLFGYSTSPFVRKVGCYLYYKKLPFEFLPVNPINPIAIGFSNQTQVPVLSIDGEWRKNSTDLGIWLDELFPEKRLLGDSNDHRKKILEIDQWVSDRFIRSMFRMAVDTPLSMAFRYRAWRLSAIVSSQSSLSDEQKNSWPEFLKQAPFILNMTNDLDRSESLNALKLNLMSELIGHLSGGPFLGGRQEPSLADFSLYPQIVFGYMVGLEATLSAATFNEISDWIIAVSKHLPENPILVPDFMVVQSLQDELTRNPSRRQTLINLVGSERFLKFMSIIAN